jgi:hypothetical protein
MRRTIATALLLSTLATPALAQEGQQPQPQQPQPQQPTCMPEDKMSAWLAAEDQEALRGAGLDDYGYLVRLYQSKTTFTLVLVAPNKMACVLDFGTDWQTRNDAPAVPEQGS